MEKLKRIHQRFRANSLKTSILLFILVLLSLNFGLTNAANHEKIIIGNSFATKTDYSKTVMDETRIYWLVNSSVSASVFPVVIDSPIEEVNISFMMSWDTYINQTLNYSSSYSLNPYPYVLWVELPNSSHGSGIVSIYVNDILNTTHPITWQKNPSINQAPKSIKLVYNWYSFWIGAGLLTANFTEDSVHITHKILSKSTNSGYMPYNRNFDITVPFQESDWQVLINYLIENDSANWQTWDFDSMGFAMCDGGGFRADIKIEWNEGLSTTFSLEKDDDTCSGKRTYCVPKAAIFSEILHNKTDEIISQHEWGLGFTGADLLIVSSTFIVSSIIILYVRKSKRKVL
ncbi:MAG: hypothetical protein ACFFDI_16735 [Promethearchaeota archaeon]